MKTESFLEGVGSRKRSKEKGKGAGAHVCVCVCRIIFLMHPLQRLHGWNCEDHASSALASVLTQLAHLARGIQHYDLPRSLTLVCCSYFTYSASVRGSGGPAAFWGV